MHKPSKSNTFTANLTEQLNLTGQHVSLEPMLIEHVDELNSAASDGELWTLKVTSVPQAHDMAAYVCDALKQREKGRQLPFVARKISDGRLIGTTRFYNISPPNRNLSIGYTWYSACVHRTAVNTECKLLLLSHAFEKAGCISVQWHAHHDNKKSHQAILRLGASFEGVLRNHQILDDGRIRHTHCFSMLDNEWPTSKGFLQQRLEAHA